MWQNQSEPSDHVPELRITIELLIATHGPTVRTCASANVDTARKDTGHTLKANISRPIESGSHAACSEFLLLESRNKAPRLAPEWSPEEMSLAMRERGQMLQVLNL